MLDPCSKWACLLFLAFVVSAGGNGDGNDSSNRHSPHHGFDVEEKKAGVEYKYATTDPVGYFPTEFLEVPVIGIRDETHNSKVFTFGLPRDVSLNLPVSSAILLNVPPPTTTSDDGKKKRPVLRPYNPISSNESLGSFSLLVKVYPGGAAGEYVGGLSVGDRVAFKQTKANVKKFRHPFTNLKNGKTVTEITMLAGGTGIAPMIQALHPILGEGEGGPSVRLLYGNKSPGDIMLRNELEDLRARHPDRFEIYYVVGETDDGGAGDASCTGEGDGTTCDNPAAAEDYESGWINEEKIGRLGYPPNDDGTSVVWVCGVNEMYDSLAGSRFKPVADGTPLRNLGFDDDTVWRS